MVPARTSTTATAPRHDAIRRGGNALRTFTTRPPRDTNATSMACRIPKVCTARQGRSRIPDLGPGARRHSNPRIRPIQPLTRSSLSRACGKRRWSFIPAPGQLDRDGKRQHQERAGKNAADQRQKHLDRSLHREPLGSHVTLAAALGCLRPQQRPQADPQRVRVRQGRGPTMNQRAAATIRHGLDGRRPGTPARTCASAPANASRNGPGGPFAAAACNAACAPSPASTHSVIMSSMNGRPRSIPRRRATPCARSHANGSSAAVKATAPPAIAQAGPLAAGGIGVHGVCIHGACIPMSATMPATGCRSNR